MCPILQNPGKVGVVKRCYSDIHAFGRGYAYSVDVQFEDELVTGIPAYYLITHI